MKITIGTGSYKVTLKKNLVDELKWNEKTEVKQKRIGKRIIIEEDVKE